MSYVNLVHPEVSVYQLKLSVGPTTGDIEIRLISYLHIVPLGTAAPTQHLTIAVIGIVMDYCAPDVVNIIH